MDTEQQSTARRPSKDPIERTVDWLVQYLTADPRLEDLTEQRSTAGRPSENLKPIAVPEQSNLEEVLSLGRPILHRVATQVELTEHGFYARSFLSRPCYLRNTKVETLGGTLWRRGFLFAADVNGIVNPDSRPKEGWLVWDTTPDDTLWQSTDKYWKEPAGPRNDSWQVVDETNSASLILGRGRDKVKTYKVPAFVRTTVVPLEGSLAQLQSEKYVLFTMDTDEDLQPIPVHQRSVKEEVLSLGAPFLRPQDMKVELVELDEGQMYTRDFLSRMCYLEEDEAEEKDEDTVWRRQFQYTAEVRAILNPDSRPKEGWLVWDKKTKPYDTLWQSTDEYWKEPAGPQGGFGNHEWEIVDQTRSASLILCWDGGKVKIDNVPACLRTRVPPLEDDLSLLQFNSKDVPENDEGSIQDVPENDEGPKRMSAAFEYPSWASTAGD